MTRARLHMIIVVLVFFVGLMPVLAQGGPTIPPVPSVNGGSFGSPGMAGATGNGAGSYQALANSLADTAGQALGGLGSGGRLGNREGGGAAGAVLGELLAGLTGGRPPAPNGALGEGGLAAMFGGDGSLAAQVNTALAAGATWAEFGGFGAQAVSEMIPPATIDNLDELWAGTLNEDWAATLNAELNSAIAAQGEAISAGTADAQTAAQAAYDLFWSDYYAAVNTMAQETFNMTLADAEALYQEAVALAYTALDTYDETAAYYATYCLYYPWDCYAYAYDAAEGAYQNVEALSQTPAGQVVMGELDSAIDTAAALAVETLASSPEAFEAIVVFANDQLGANVEPLYAGSLTQDIANYLVYLPDEIVAYASLFSDVTTYWGLLRGGVAGVAIIDCATDMMCAVENLAVELSDASGGLYALDVSAPLPGNADAALALITTVFPKLNGLPFSQIMDMDEGMAFLATAYGVGADNNGQPLTVAKLIYTGVINLEGQTLVYALVAVGETQIQAFYGLFQ